jgi:exonuclease I
MGLFIAIDRLLEVNYKDHKLVTVAKAEGIEFDAHDALADIKATRDLMLIAGSKYLMKEF